MSTFIRTLALLIALLISGAANAAPQGDQTERTPQTSPGRTDSVAAINQPNAQYQTSGAIRDALKDMLLGMRTELNKAAGRVQEGIGNPLLWSLSVFAIIMIAFNILFEGGQFNKIGGEITRTIFMIGLAQWFMFGENGSMLIGFIDSLLSDVASKIRDDPASVTDPATGSVVSMFTAAIHIMAAMWNGVVESFYQMLDSSSFLGATWNFLNWLIGNSLAITFYVIAGLLIFIAAMMTFVIVMMGETMFAFGYVVAPLFIPMLVLPITNRYFQGWLNFMISAAMWKVVCAAMVVVSLAIFDAMAKHNVAAIEGSSLAALSIIIGAIVAAGMSLAVVFLMLSVPSIANGMLQGSANADMKKALGEVASAGFATAAALAGGMAGLKEGIKYTSGKPDSGPGVADGASGGKSAGQSGDKSPPSKMRLIAGAARAGATGSLEKYLERKGRRGGVDDHFVHGSSRDDAKQSARDYLDQFNPPDNGPDK